MTLDRRQFLKQAILIGGSALMAEDAFAQAAQQLITKASAGKSAAKPAVVPKKIVAIDAGHGGKDPGAIGAQGTYEKLITFAVARELARQLEATGRYTPILTRRNDTFVALGARVSLARRAKSTLFLSLHADSIPNNPDARGFSVYTLSDKASDNMTAALADRENAADFVGGLDLSHHSRQVKTILLDLMHRETTNNSLALAHATLAKMTPAFPPLQKPHRQANFAVLRSPDIPSILVEMGFLSNREDEKALRGEAYQRKLASRLTLAVDAFFTV
jgi:N-acetylmuramoyl-L-alanine amidase